MIRAALIATCLLTAVPALACSPAGGMQRSTAWQLGENCARGWVLDEINAVQLGPLTALGNGLVMQPLREGNGCYFEVYRVVQDCRTGQGLLIGPERIALMEGPKPSGLDTMDKRIRAQHSLPTLQSVSALATAGQVVALPRGASLRFEGATMPLDCACKTAYPALKSRG